MERREAGWGVLALRVMLGIIFLVHGWDKLFGQGVGAFTQFLMIEDFPPPPALAWAMTVLELAGGLLLLVGWLVRWAAIALFVEILVSLAAVHAPNGFFVFQPYGAWGYEYHLALLGGLACLALAGGGALAVDAVAARRAAAPATDRTDLEA